MRAIYLKLVLVLLVGFSGCDRPVKNNNKGSWKQDSITIFRELQATTTQWNNGNLAGFTALYDSSTTFMTAKGLIGLDSLNARYKKRYFNGSKPKQQLSFSELETRPLGKDYALVTGRFLLTGGGLPEQSGRFSLVFSRTSSGWKILHDHSS